MRAGNAQEFFRRQDASGRWLAEKNHWLDQAPQRYVASLPEAAPMIAELWHWAEQWQQVTPIAGLPRDLSHLARLWEPDLLLVDGQTMHMVAGAVCMPSSWSLDHAIGKTVHEIHDVIPRLNPQIGGKIDRFLRQIPEGKSFQRENWSFTRSSEKNYHPSLQRQKLDEFTPLAEIYLRLEQQIFSAIAGGIAMGLRIQTCPVTDLATDAHTWQQVIHKVRTMTDDVAEYKSMQRVRETMVDQMLAYQPQGGVD